MLTTLDSKLYIELPSLTGLISATAAFTRGRLSASRTRLFIGDYVVDLHERSDYTYYAISKKGCDDIISMGHETTYADAEASARWTITQLDPNATDSIAEGQSA
jgi:hypothetical protein